MRSWDDRNQRFSITYDDLRRPVDRTVSVSGGSEKLLSRIVYGELLASPATTNHRGRVYRVYDGAGVATTLAFDFKGHALQEQRQLYDDETAQPDWTDLLGEDTIAEMATAAASLLDAETFSASSERDALGRVLTAISPDGSEVHYLYDEGGALQQVTLNHRGSETEQTVVGDIIYDAKGRREEVVYGPTGDPTSTTTYTYDELSQRLIRMRTVRESDSEAIQSLHYHYDPVGNITDIRDTAQQTVYFDNTVVSATNSYTYDALYRLVEATGREHSSEGTAQRTHADMTATAQPMTSDPSAMRLYTQQFVYDEVGNILEMKHIPSLGTGWTRYYQYDDASNRLEATSASGDDPEGPYNHEYEYDAHGNMVEMPHLSAMIWNHDDELQEVTAGSETVYFQYAGGNRSRKYVEKSGSITEERIYLGNFEIYRKRISGDIDVERESLHISDGTGRILLIETKTIDEGDPVTTPTGIWRYQLSNHIGSASTEITEDGDIISYEEYHPYGTTAYRAVDSSVDVSAKRYRYTGMERDEETGLSYHTARYYASWLGRWSAADPIGIGDDLNRYAYVGNPVGSTDLNGNEEGSITRGLWRRFAPRSADADTGSGDVEDGARGDSPELSEESKRAAALESIARQEAALTPQQRIERAARLAARAKERHAQWQRGEHQRKTEVSIGADGVIGTEGEHRGRRFEREIAVVTGPTVAAISYAGGEGVSLEAAEAIGTVEGAFGSLAHPLKPVTGRATVPQGRVIDRLEPSRSDKNVEHIPTGQSVPVARPSQSPTTAPRNPESMVIAAGPTMVAQVSQQQQAKARSGWRPLTARDAGLEGTDATIWGNLTVRGTTATITIQWLGRGEQRVPGSAATGMLEQFKRVAREAGATHVRIETTQIVEQTGRLQRILGRLGFQERRNGTMYYEGPL